MHEFLERVGLEFPIVQAGMGGGVAGPTLAAAVSEAGGLGTLGTASPATMATWPGAHRVLRNKATERWLRHDDRGPVAVRCINRLTRPALTRVPDLMQQWITRNQVLAVPFFSPVPPTGAASGRVLETSPLYAGETVARIADIAPAASIVRARAVR